MVETGYSPHEVLGHNCRFLQGRATCPLKVKEIKDAIMYQKCLMIEIENYRKDGSGFMNRFLLTPICRDDGKVTYFAGVQSCPQSIIDKCGLLLTPSSSSS